MIAAAKIAKFLIRENFVTKKVTFRIKPFLALCDAGELFQETICGCGLASNR
jgi:hypothetical protein